MGLDMYLHARKYVSGWEHGSSEDRNEFERLLDMFEVKDVADIEGSPHAYIEVCVAYWRKANQIHAWFVENVQNGTDDCGTYYVSRMYLETLRDLCKQVLNSTTLIDGTVHNGTVYSAEHPKGAVQLEEGKILADPRLAHELLPTQEGFFFGGQDYDEGYWCDLEHTVERIDKALSLPDTFDFQYHSSW